MRKGSGTKELHLRIFPETYGPGPYLCHACGETVETGFHMVIHHLDGDHENNAIDNLVAMHRSCHAREHHTGRRNTSETRARMSSSAKKTFADGRKTWTEGKPLPPETARKISQWRSTQAPCDLCGTMVYLPYMKRHQRSDRCVTE